MEKTIESKKFIQAISRMFEYNVAREASQNSLGALETFNFSVQLLQKICCVIAINIIYVICGQNESLLLLFIKQFSEDLKEHGKELVASVLENGWL